MKAVDHAGHLFGRLTALEKIKKGKFVYYKCRCSCGTEKVVSYTNLKNRTTQSCGCLQKELLSKRSSKPLYHTVTNQILWQYKRNAKNRNYEWLLTDEEFRSLIEKNCYFCTVPPANIVKTSWNKEKRLAFNGIDRIDNTIGYVMSNCVPCCRICNSAKGNLTVEQFRQWIQRLHANMFGGNQ